MKVFKTMLVVIAVCGFMANTLSPTATSNPSSLQGGTTYQDIPPGFDFPADEATLLGFRDAGNESAMRTHAWMVFAGMTQPAPGGEAIWETWFSEEETFRAGPSPQALAPRRVQRRFRLPRQFSTPTRGPSLQAVGASLLSFVLFNKDALTHIRSNRLNSQSKLNQLNQGFNANGTPVEKREIPPFPRTAMSIKTTWWLVKKAGLTPMPVWDGKPTQPNEKGNDYPTWARFVAVDPSRTQIPAGEKLDIFFQGKLKKDSRVVPLANLYNFQLTQNELNAVRSVPGFQDAQVGDYAALVAMHYTTKEIPDWVWTTFWWHDSPNDGTYAKDRPGAVSGVWRNYLMDVTFSSDVPKEPDNTPNVCFNPWLEARFAGGLTSNCMSCHQHAVWTPVSFLPVTRGSLPPNDQFFLSKTKLDFLWSIAFSSQ